MLVAKRSFIWNGEELKPGDKISARGLSEVERKRLEVMIKAGMVREVNPSRSSEEAKG